MSVYEILRVAAESRPARAAMIDAQGVISYRELYEQTEALKAELISTGLGAGMGLGVMGRNGRQFVMAMFAGMGCGATVVPLSHQLKQAELDTILSDTGIHALVDDLTGALPSTSVGGSIQLNAQALRFSRTGVARHKPVTPLADAAFIRYTSGTTGQCKGVVLSHQRIRERVCAAHSALSLTEKDAVLWVLPMAYHFLVSILVYLRCGALIIVCQDLLAETLINAANRHHATMLYAAPMHFRLLAADQSGKQMPALKYAFSTSAALPPAVAEDFRKRFHLPITQAYGIIEAGLPLLDSLTETADPESVGYPAAGFDAALLDERDLPVVQGEAGRLAIRGPGMFDAYLRPWRSAARVMANGWFMTGDLARQRSDGRFVICGREKTMINVSGNKVFPEEIEAVLNNHPRIIDSRVFGQTHPLWGEIVCAELVVAAGEVLDAEQVLRFCRDRLSAYKVPQRLMQVRQICYTGTGKVQRV